MMNLLMALLGGIAIGVGVALGMRFLRGRGA
jgi:hypothetical protein